MIGVLKRERNIKIKIEDSRSAQGFKRDSSCEDRQKKKESNIGVSRSESAEAKR